MPLGLSLRFQSDRFDHRSELPEDCNAGNRFYGKDVAEFVATGLAARGHAAAVNDEDWGWLVSGRQPDGNPFEVAIYNLSEHREGGKPGTNEWGLWVGARESRKFLGILPRSVAVSVPPALEAAVRVVFATEGIELGVWDEGTDDDA
jgi:hypothetical protein